MNKLYFLGLILILFSCNKRALVVVFNDYEAGLKLAKSENRKILLFFDIWGKSTHKISDMLQEEDILYLLKDYVLIQLMVDDRSKAKDGKMTIGEINRAIQLKYHSRNQPMFYIINPEETVVKDPLGYCKKDEFVSFITKE